ncbi:hypothetical protein PILCRDRAFT_83848 [Piloderma croceum F 1598]|uniref:Translation initiation factor beta propellor-like domain-containing protein n=1 Tax=Piloderma croceum (strain F 1598) TaxID=765440 RepID=A0A0C3CQ15_PILCF|nr:hypothetical protein PILCRDRAFT_83848 [Piloderma croceum F 1598]
MNESYLEPPVEEYMPRRILKGAINTQLIVEMKCRYIGMVKSPSAQWLTSNRVRAFEEQSCSILRKSSHIDEGNQIAIWEIASGNLLRTFPAIHADGDDSNVKAQMRWPVMKWSPDDNYVARVTPGQQISVYELPDMGLEGKKSIKIEGVMDFEWHLLEEAKKEQRKMSGVEEAQQKGNESREHILAYWTPDIANRPARVTSLAVLLFAKKNYSVSLRTRATSYNKTVFCNLEIFHVRRKQSPVEIIELKDAVLDFSWEPQGERFAIVSSGDLNLGNNGSGSLLKFTLAFTSYAPRWAPRGRFVVLVTVGYPSKLELQFWDLDFNVEDCSNLIRTGVSKWGKKCSTQKSGMAFMTMNGDATGHSSGDTEQSLCDSHEMNIWILPSILVKTKKYYRSAHMMSPQTSLWCHATVNFSSSMAITPPIAKMNSNGAYKKRQRTGRAREWISEFETAHVKMERRWGPTTPFYPHQKMPSSVGCRTAGDLSRNKNIYDSILSKLIPHQSPLALQTRSNAECLVVVEASHSSTTSNSMGRLTIRPPDPFSELADHPHSAESVRDRLTSPPQLSLSLPVNQTYKCGVPGCGQSFQAHADLLQHDYQPRPDFSNPTGLSQGPKFPCDSSYISIASSPPPSFPSPSPSSPSLASPTGAFMSNPENVDARYGAFHNVSGSQYHINQLIGQKEVGVSDVRYHVIGGFSCSLADGREGAESRL